MSPRRTIVGRDPASAAGIAVTIADGRIAEIRAAEAPDDAAFIAPALVDLQVNGYGGLDLNSPDLSIGLVAELTDRLAALGTTCYQPTVITASEAAIIKALQIIAEARRKLPRVKNAIPAVHVEGPHISPLDGARGAHPRDQVRPPDADEFARWQEACDGLVGMVTLSPEYDEAPAYITALAGQGIAVSLGHMAATAEQVRAAADAGARLSTHLGNGAAATLPRHPNFIWAQLADDRLTASFISDGHHLPADTFKAMLRAKGLDRAVLISDSVALAGMPPGLYDQPIGGQVEVMDNGRICVAGTPYLAGAGQPLAASVGLAMAAAGLPLADALRLATRNPGRFVGGRGTLDVGACADLMTFRLTSTNDLKIESVLVAGEEVLLP